MRVRIITTELAANHLRPTLIWSGRAAITISCEPAAAKKAARSHRRLAPEPTRRLPLARTAAAATKRCLQRMLRSAPRQGPGALRLLQVYKFYALDPFLRGVDHFQPPSKNRQAAKCKIRIYRHFCVLWRATVFVALVRENWEWRWNRLRALLAKLNPAWPCACD